MGETTSFHNAFKQFLKEKNLSGSYQQRQLMANWERTMGKPIAARTKKLFFQKNTLFVELTSAALKDELTRSKVSVQERIREQYPTLELEEIRFI